MNKSINYRELESVWESVISAEHLLNCLNHSPEAFPQSDGVVKIRCKHCGFMAFTSAKGAEYMGYGVCVEGETE